MTRPRIHPFQRGFTLVELLVVVSIIAMLIALLLPSLAKAKEVSRDIKCRANLRAVFFGATLYGNSYNQHILPTSMGYGQNNLCPAGIHPAGEFCDFFDGPNGPHRWWYQQIASFLDFTDDWRESGGANNFWLVPKNPQIFFCPSDAGRSHWGRAVNTLDSQGFDYRWTGSPNAANSVYQWDSYFYVGSYGWNLNAGHQCAVRKLRFGELSKKTGSEFVLLGDVHLPDGNNANQGRFNSSDMSASNYNITNRHLGGGNYGFADGHIAPMTQEFANAQANATWNTFDRTSVFTPGKRMITRHYSVSSTD